MGGHTSGTRHGNGSGWGGGAKGGGDRDAEPFAEGNTVQAQVRPDRAARKAERAQRAQELEDHLYTLALTAERQDTQVMAAVRLHAILEGQPVARNFNVNVNDLAERSDDELAAEHARLDRAEAAAAAGDVAPPMPGRPDPVVH